MLISEAEAVSILQSVGRCLRDPLFVARLVSLLVKHEFVVPNLPAVRQWQIEAIRHMRANGVRRADLRFVLTHRFDITAVEADRLIDRAEG